MSEIAQRFKKHYDLGCWSVQTLEKAVEKNIITKQEFDEIIGE